MGPLQGSILSVTLFSIKINSLANVLNDNFLICFRVKNMNIIKGQLQLCLIKIKNLVIVNGFTFCSSKNCRYALFQQKRNPQNGQVSFLIVNLHFYLILKCFNISALKHQIYIKMCVQYRLGCGLYGFIRFTQIVESIRIVLRMCRLLSVVSIYKY